MNQYTIYCTKEQTKKALKLGAPIEKVDTRDKHMIYYGHLCYPRTEADYPYAIPTAEQMISWLEKQGLIEGITIGYAEGIDWFFDVNNLSEPFISTLNLNSRKEATLAAIDAALEYLLNNKEQL